MFLRNSGASNGVPLDPEDAKTLGLAAAEEAERFQLHNIGHAETPLHALPSLAAELGLGALHVKDEGHRHGLGSFKALGGAYAVARLVLEEAGRVLGRAVGVSDLQSAEVRALAAGMTFACATDGNHGRSVAFGAARFGARSVIFVHEGVSALRVTAIARFGAAWSGLPEPMTLRSPRQHGSPEKPAGPSFRTRPGPDTNGFPGW